MSDKKINDGGPAFPLVAPVDWSELDEGMSLRQWYAGRAFPFALAKIDERQDIEHPTSQANAAALAVTLADALIAALTEPTP